MHTEPSLRTLDAIVCSCAAQAREAVGRWGEKFVYELLLRQHIAPGEVWSQVGMVARLGVGINSGLLVGISAGWQGC